MRQLSEQQAYLAMFSFLEAEYRMTKSDELGGLLGGLSLLSDGTPADPAVKAQWSEAVSAALDGQIDVAFKLRPGER
ncbi:MAG: hypothetical protein V4805_08330 [Pseudomonadota bacterium]